MALDAAPPVQFLDGPSVRTLVPGLQELELKALVAALGEVSFVAQHDQHSGRGEAALTTNSISLTAQWQVRALKHPSAS